MKFSMAFLILILSAGFSASAQTDKTFTLDEVQKLVLDTKHQIEEEANKKIKKRDIAINELEKALVFCKEELKNKNKIEAKLEEKCTAYFEVYESRKKLSQLCEEQLGLSKENTHLCTDNEKKLKEKLLQTQELYEEAAHEADKPFYKRPSVWIAGVLGLLLGIPL